MGTSETSFIFTKWYLDCVADNGNLFIGYSSSLSWKKLSLHHVAALSCVNDNIKEESKTVTKECFPVENDSQIIWDCPQLDLRGEWATLASLVECTLLDTEDGAVRWECLQPGSQVTILDSRIGSITGLGYVERIEMTIKPWHLPIDQLHWGRFVCEQDQIVWIEWRGPDPKVLIFHNGKQTSGGSISETSIKTGTGLTLELSDHLVLREGKIGEKALAKLSSLLHILPSKILKIHERKWRSRGLLHKNGTIKNRGWVIHEIVNF